MYKTNFPKPIHQQTPIGGLRPTNILEANEKKNIFSKPLVSIPPQTTPIQQTPHITQQPSNSKEEDEFKDMVKERLSKIDEFLVLMKEKQDTIFNNNIPQNNQPPSEPPKQTVEKKTRGKKTYYKITDNMWNEIKTNYVDLPDKYKVHTYSDGTDFYVEHKNKKILLDGKCYLKLLNDK